MAVGRRRMMPPAILVLLLAFPAVVNAATTTYFNGWVPHASYRTSGTATVRGGTTFCDGAGSACATNYLHAHYYTSEHYWGAYHTLYHAYSLGAVSMVHLPENHSVSRCVQLNATEISQPITCKHFT